MDLSHNITQQAIAILFIKWLKERRVYIKFKKNFLCSKGVFFRGSDVKLHGNEKYYIVDYFISTKMDNGLLHSFNWSETDEGHAFWEHLASSWEYDVALDHGYVNDLIERCCRLRKKE